MNHIGFTTGSLYYSKISLEEITKLYSSLGADAIELSFATPNQLIENKISKETFYNLQKYKFISLHAPWKEVRYDFNEDTDKILDKLTNLCDTLPIRGIVLHPDTINRFEILIQSGLPLLIENMDKRKLYGTNSEQFKELKRKYNFGFVLDVQHAYEHDSSMQLAKEFISVIGNKLNHMHISGSSESEIHVPTFNAINKEAITNILKLNINVPKILEGRLNKDIEETIKKELEYVRSFEDY